LGAIGQDADDTASGTTQEITGNNRQRYTLFTSVSSWHREDDPPKMEVLFKATPHGTVIKGLLESDRVPPLMKVQVQENGSYRSGDVVEALEWMLPDAKTAAESIVVMLDGYSAHLTPEVREVISRKGHVLMFHGGGCTPFTQISDTHLHASLSRVWSSLRMIGRARVRRERDQLELIYEQTAAGDSLCKGVFTDATFFRHSL
jgi:hypothetical protein